MQQSPLCTNKSNRGDDPNAEQDTPQSTNAAYGHSPPAPTTLRHKICDEGTTGPWPRMGVRGKETDALWT